MLLLVVCAFANGCPLAPKPAAVSKTVAASAAALLQEEFKVLFESVARQILDSVSTASTQRTATAATATPPSAPAASAVVRHLSQQKQLNMRTVAAGTWTLNVALRLIE